MPASPPATSAWPLWMKLLWQLLAIAVLFTRGPEFIQSLRNTRDGVDFLQEWSSVKNWELGRPLYAPLPQTVPMDLPEMVRGRNITFPIQYNAHPPSAVLVTLPVAWPLGYLDAVVVWNLLMLAALAAAGWILLRELNLRVSPWLWLPGLALLLLYNPFRQQMNQGQITALVLLLLTLAWRADRHGHSRRAGFWIGLATAIKLFPGLFFVYFLLCRDWRAVIAGTASFLLISLLTVLLFGTSAYTDYVETVMPAVRQFQPAKLNSSIHGFVSKLLEGSVTEGVTPLKRSPDLQRLFTYAACGVVGLMLFFRTVTSRAEANRYWLFALWLVAMLLLSPITWDHSLLLVTLPLLLLWQSAENRVMQANVLLLVLLFSMNHQGEWLARIKAGTLPTPVGPRETLTCLAVLFYALVLLFVLVWQKGQERRT